MLPHTPNRAGFRAVCRNNQKHEWSWDFMSSQFYHKQNTHAFAWLTGTVQRPTTTLSSSQRNSSQCATSLAAVEPIITPFGSPLLRAKFQFLPQNPWRWKLIEVYWTNDEQCWILTTYLRIDNSIFYVSFMGKHRGLPINKGPFFRGSQFFMTDSILGLQPEAGVAWSLVGILRAINWHRTPWTGRMGTIIHESVIVRVPHWGNNPCIINELGILDGF